MIHMSDGKNIAKRCTVCVVVRDRFSTTFRCLDNLIANTPEPYELVVILGGAPAHVQKALQEGFGHKARFVFEKKFLNQAEYRNIALRETQTPLVAIVENDVYVRPGWLPPLIRCLDETGAGFVVPLVLEAPTIIHTAGNDLMITHKNGKSYGHKVLRYAKIMYYEDSNIQRARTDYGELHCQLFQAEPARRLEIFDERLHEPTEVDSGLMMAKGGYEMWFEPTSVVDFDFPERITKVEDIRVYKFKWDQKNIVESMAIFEKKWGIDLTALRTWPVFLTSMNQRLGIWSRIFPSRWAVAVDEFYYLLKSWFKSPLVLWRKFKDWRVGHYRWQTGRGRAGKRG